MELKEADIINNDYDWFVIINHTPIHVASDGTPLPIFIAKHFDEQISARKQIKGLPQVVDLKRLQINPNLPEFTGLYNYPHEYIQIIDAYNEYKGNKVEEDRQKYSFIQNIFRFGQKFNVINNVIKLKEYLARIYVPEFIKFGEKGFLSFDHSIDEDNTNSFHWVVNPNIRMTEEIQQLNLPSFDLDNDDSFEVLLSDKCNIVELVDKYLN